MKVAGMLGFLGPFRPGRAYGYGSYTSRYTPAERKEYGRRMREIRRKNAGCLQRMLAAGRRVR